MAIDQLSFDTTDSQTVLDSHSVGAYVRSGESGALITHHAPIKAGTAPANFADGDVTIGTDLINTTAHGFLTGDLVQLTSTGTLPAGLTLATDYYIIRVDANNYKLAASKIDAENGDAVDITAAAGTGVHTTTGQDADTRALDVWVMNPSFEVTATDLDIRDLTAASDSVESWTHDGTGTAITSTGGALDVFTGLGQDEDTVHSSGDTGVMTLGVRNDAGTVMAADGDYIPLSMDADGALRVNAVVNVDALSDYAEDSAHVSGDIGGYVLAVRQDTLASSTDADGDYGSLKLDSVGSLYTHDTGANALLATIDTDTSSINSTLTALTQAEDSVHVSGDQGIMGLMVRNDAGTPLAADGDYVPFMANAVGSLNVNLTNTDVAVNDAALANTAIAHGTTALASANIAESAIGTALTDRKYAFIRNNDNRRMYVGGASVSSATGFPISPGSYVEFRAGAAVDIQFVSAKASHDLRYLELS